MSSPWDGLVRSEPGNGGKVFNELKRVRDGLEHGPTGGGRAGGGGRGEYYQSGGAGGVLGGQQAVSRNNSLPNILGAGGLAVGGGTGRGGRGGRNH